MLSSPESSAGEGCSSALHSLIQGLGTAAALVGSTLAVAMHRWQSLVNVGFLKTFCFF